jgi:hypothetical protein
VVLSQEEVARIWGEIDYQGNGSLHYPQVAEFFKKVYFCHNFHRSAA